MGLFGRRLTLTEQAVTAVDRIQTDIADLQTEREDALSCFRCTVEREDALSCLRCTAERLAALNTELGEKAALCGTLAAQLTRAQEDIVKQVPDNEQVRWKILNIIGD